MNVDGQRAITAVIGCLVVCLLAACNRGEIPLDERSRAVATVNGAVLSVADFEGTYVAFLINTGANDTPRNRHRHLNGLIDTYLLAEEARRRGLDRDSAFLAFEARALKKAVGGRFYETAFLATLPPLSDADVRRAFARSKQQVVVRHLFYRNEAEAQAAYERLQAGRDFVDEAQDCYGTAAYDSLAGYLGPIRYFQMDDAFAEAAFGLDLGQYTPPVRSRFGFHIIRVEDRILNPILTESEYQTRRAGIASQLRLRKRRLEGDRFVRGYMEDLDVQVNPEGIRALALALQDLEHRVTPEPLSMAPDVELAVLDLGALRAAFVPETPLATYRIAGETRTFTARDYYFWLEDLPFAEARHRTAASVGRALRNEVFAQAGIARGLGDEAPVRREVENQSRIYLAGALQAQLRQEAAEAPPDEAFLREAYERMGRPRQQGSFEERKTELARTLGPLVPEFYLLKDLRGGATVDVDTLLFEQIMTLEAGETAHQVQ